MKFLSYRFISVLFALIPLVAFAGEGGDHSGGGTYGKINGRWVLLDDIEEGNFFMPEEHPTFAGVKALLARVEATVPPLATELKKTLSKKWHLVKFELQCEAPVSPVKTEFAVGACQDERDVWVNEQFISANLVIHELIQGMRIQRNLGPDAPQLPPSAVRAVKRVLTAKDFPTAALLRETLRETGFGIFPTSDELALIAAERSNYIARVCGTQSFAGGAEEAAAMETATSLISHYFNRAINESENLALAGLYLDLGKSLRTGLLGHPFGRAASSFCATVR